jgi:hypothetical protein
MAYIVLPNQKNQKSSIGNPSSPGYLSRHSYAKPDLHFPMPAKKTDRQAKTRPRRSTRFPARAGKARHARPLPAP